MSITVRRLSWAGLEIVAGQTRVLIDPLYHVAPLKQMGLGDPLEPMVPVGQAESARAALVTHRHPDHYDPLTLRRVLEADGEVLCPAAMRDTVDGDGLAARGVDIGERVEIGPMEIYPVPAVDGFGEAQVSWVVLHDDLRLLHGGDTLWHGYWWSIAREYGPFDVACLPVNGPMVSFRGWAPSGVPAALTPAQAVAAARLLGAARMCPIHYGTFNHPPTYVEYPRIPDALAEADAPDLVIAAVAPGNAVWPADDGG